mgnify:FL=1
MRVLVTGGAGNIGLAVLDQLAFANIKTALFDLPQQIEMNRALINADTEVFQGSVLDKSSLSEALRGCTHVIHLAAVLGVQNTETNNLNCLEINTKGTENVLSGSISEKVSKFVFASSSEVYGEPLKLPINEDSITQGKTLYAISKLAGEEFVKAYSQRYSFLNYSILRLFNSFGPNQVGQFVITKFLHNAMVNKPIVINGDGEQLRSFCYVDDTARGIVAALKSDKANAEVINIGNQNNFVTINDLARIILEILNLDEDERIIYNPDFDNSDRAVSSEFQSPGEYSSKPIVK